MSGILPVISRIETSGGTALDPCETIRVKAPLTVSRVAGSGPARFELGLFSAPGLDTSPLAVMVKQDPLVGYTGGDFEPVVIAMAPRGAASIITRIDYYTSGSVSADPVDYVRAIFNDYDSATGTLTGSGIFIPSTAATDWDASSIAFSWVPSGGYELAAGHVLEVYWNWFGAGVDVPAGAFRIE